MKVKVGPAFLQFGPTQVEENPLPVHTLHNVQATQKIYVYLCGTGGTLNGYVGVFVSSDDGLIWTNTNPLGMVGGTYTIPTHTNLMANNGTTGFNQGFYDMAIVVNPKTKMN